MIEVATDGSSLGNPGNSAWAWYVTDNRWRSGFIGRGTNNKAELMAIREAALEIPSRLEVLCLADSQYAIQCLSRGRGGFLSAWERNGKLEKGLVANADLIKETLAAIEARQGAWVFEWVRGHCGHPLNTEADRLANTAAGSKAKPGTNYGPGWSISKKGLVIAKKTVMYDVTDQKNIDILAQMIAAETSGLEDANPEPEDIELARITAAFIKQIVTDTNADRCIIRN